MELTGARLSWIPEGGTPVDLTGATTRITMQLVPMRDPIEEMVSAGYFSRSQVYSGRLKLTPYGYRMLFGRTHPRIRRLHAAYRRKRKGW